MVSDERVEVLQKGFGRLNEVIELRFVAGGKTSMGRRHNHDTPLRRFPIGDLLRGLKNSRATPPPSLLVVCSRAWPRKF